MKLSTLSQVCRSILLTALILLILPISFSLSAQEQEKGAPTKHRLALVGGTIYPAPFERPITNGVVLIENGKIIEVGEKAKLQIPPGAETIDCAGRIIVAGFWNSHVHFTEPKWENAANLPPARLTNQLQEMLNVFIFVHFVHPKQDLTSAH